LIPDAEAVEDTAVSLSFDVQVTDALSGYVRLFHLDITIRTRSFAHGSVSCFANHTKKDLTAVSLAEMLLSGSPFDEYIFCIGHCVIYQLLNGMIHRVMNQMRVSVTTP
jgi:hypothetical protein